MTNKKIVFFFISFLVFSCVEKDKTKTKQEKSNVILTKKDPINEIIKKFSEDKYDLLEKKMCDLNSDKKNDYILVFSNKSDFLSGFPETYIAPIVIMLSNGNKFYVLNNYNIYPNNFGDYYDDIKIKDNYFTLELANVKPNDYESEKYITFKFKDGKIILHKFSELIDWKDGSRSTINLDEKNFKQIPFSNFNSNEISEFYPKK